MITRLNIGGFKAFGPGGIDIPLAPITVLLGSNSIGKSSIFQALIGLQQSWSDFPDIYWYSPKGPSMDLGRFGNILHRYGQHVASSLDITIENDQNTTLTLRWFDPNASEIKDDDSATRPPYGKAFQWQEAPTPNNIADRGQLYELEVIPQQGNTTFQFKADWNAPLNRLELTLSKETIDNWLAPSHRNDQARGNADTQRPQDSGEIDNNESTAIRDAVAGGARFVWHIEAWDDRITLPQVELSPLPRSGQENAQEKATIGEKEELGRRASITIQEMMANRPTPHQSLWTAATRALEQTVAFRRSVRSMSYIDGLRERGRRLYDLSVADHPWKVGRYGERLADVLVIQPDAIFRTNELLRTAGIDYQVHVVDPSTQAQVREILLESFRDGEPRGRFNSLPDVGTGIAQLLPIVVQLAAMGNPERFATAPTLLVEQPELHLHPRFQGQLARLFAEAVSHTETTRDIQIIAETHSEHLVLGLGAMIYQGKLKPEDVSVLKFHHDRHTGETMASSIRFTDDGRFFDDWPDGFFPERLVLEEGQIP